MVDQRDQPQTPTADNRLGIQTSRFGWLVAGDADQEQMLGEIQNPDEKLCPQSTRNADQGRIK